MGFRVVRRVVHRVVRKRGGQIDPAKLVLRGVRRCSEGCAGWCAGGGQIDLQIVVLGGAQHGALLIFWASKAGTEICRALEVNWRKTVCGGVNWSKMG